MGWADRFKLYDPAAKDRTELTGLVFEIERFAIHNGPGIRTLVFLKGCLVGCGWCQNPESYGRQPEIMRNPDKCIGCGTCVEQCRGECLIWSPVQMPLRDRSRCLLPECGNCEKVCYSEAITISGRYLTVAEVMSVVERDREFYDRTSGGVTFSGGEPMAQAVFLEALAKEAKARGLDTALETCGGAPWNSYQSVLRYIDTVIYDLKHLDSKKHIEYTGVPNGVFLENLKRIDALGLPIRVRLPLVPGFNDSPESIRAVAAFVASLKNLQALDILPYHRMCEPKWEHLERFNQMHGIPSQPMDQVRTLAELARESGIEVTIGG
jgi:pyruvate formate lyase activating enzyme